MSESDIDLAALDKYLTLHIPGYSRLESCQKFSDGQSNPTYVLATTTGNYVLRRQPFGQLLKSAHAVDREYRVINALNTTDFPVPTVIHLCEDAQIIGSMFYVMEYVSGQIYWNPQLPECTPSERTQIYNEMNRVLAQLHDLQISALGLDNFGKPGNYFERQVKRWITQYRASETERILPMEELMSWLPANLPADDGKASLIHGDYRIDNMIFDPITHKVVALLDWELSTIGHPYADLAYQCMQWRLDTDGPIPGLGNIDRNQLGIPTEEQYVEQYCRTRQLQSVPHWDYFLVFSFFRLAAILQGIKKRAIDGNASNDKADSYGDVVPMLARQAIEITK